jgi:hypothetical protein
LTVVDPSDYDPDEHRGRPNGEPYGEPVMTVDGWRLREAFSVWLDERLAWHSEFGWPRQLTVVYLLRQARNARHAASEHGK